MNYDDLEDEEGQLLTEEEFMERLKYRPDIFTFQKEQRLHGIEAACLIAGIASGMWLTRHEMATMVQPDFIDKNANNFSVKVIDDRNITRPWQPKKPEPIKIVANASAKRALARGHSAWSGKNHEAPGDPRERMTRMGILALISDKVAGKSVASADIFGKGGVASKIDVILQGKNGLKTGGSPGAGRKGEEGIGFGPGTNGGPGDVGDLGVDDIIGLMLPASGDLKLANPENKRTGIAIREPELIHTGAIVGGRSRASVMRVVMQNLVALRYAYNKRLREKPGLQGKITCKFAIDEFGKIVFCEMTGSTVSDPQLEAEVIAKIRAWVFDKIDKPGDITEVVYPFAFAQ
jgi:hypothetical protein